MKHRQLVIINIIFVGLMLFSMGTVYQFMTGNKPLAALQNIGHRNKPLTVTTSSCSTKPAIRGLNNAKDPYLKKLAVYQEACHSFVTNTMMIFVGMPVSAQSASQNAQSVSATLKSLPITVCARLLWLNQPIMPTV